jgi:hypothetical protein
VNDKQKRDSLTGLDDTVAALVGEHEQRTQPTRREDEQGRTWDERHKAASFRIRERDAERIETRAQELGLSKDALGAALLWAALDALDAGTLALDIDTLESQVTDKLGRVRSYSRKRARPLWQNPPLVEHDR